MTDLLNQQSNNAAKKECRMFDVTMYSTYVCIHMHACECLHAHACLHVSYPCIDTHDAYEYTCMCMHASGQQASCQKLDVTPRIQIVAPVGGTGGPRILSHRAYICCHAMPWTGLLGFADLPFRQSPVTTQQMEQILNLGGTPPGCLMRVGSLASFCTKMFYVVFSSNIHSHHID